MGESVLRKGRHSVSRLVGYLVFATKYRKRILEGKHLTPMHFVCIRGAEKSGFQLLEFNGEPDHGHLLIEHSPATTVSQIAAQVKDVTSRVLRKEFGFQGTHLWSPSYFASSAGGASIETLRQYIKSQDAPD